MRTLIKILDDRPPIAVDDDLQVEGVLRDAAAEARIRGKLGAILIEVGNKNSMTMVVGSSDTVSRDSAPCGFGANWDGDCPGQDVLSRDSDALKPG